MSINKLFSKPLLALAIPSVVLVALYYVLAVPVLNQMNRQAVVEQAAESAQQLIDSHVEALLDQVELAANSYSVANTLIVTDVQQIDALNKHWQAFFSQSQRVAFLPYGNLGLTGLGQLGASLENNIERDLVSQAIKKKAPQVDFYSINNQQVLLFAAPVFEQPALTSDSKAVGALFMAVDSAWLQSMLSHIEENYDNGVSLRLLQSDSGKPLASFSNFTGEASVKQRLNRVSHLTVEAEKSASSILAPIFGVIIMGVCALMMLVGLRLPASRETQVEAKVTEDAEQLSSYIGNLVAGTKKGKTLEPKLAFAANQEMLSSIKKALDRAKVDAKAQMALNDQFDLGGVTEPQAVASEAQAKTVDASQPVSIPDVIFRAYDVRGHADELLLTELQSR